MTSLTNAEIKTIYFGITFFILVGVFVSLYNLAPVQQIGYAGETSASNQTSTQSSDWIASLVAGLPAPFNNTSLLIVVSVFVTPVTLMLGYVAVRALKDLVSQWV